MPSYGAPSVSYASGSDPYNQYYAGLYGNVPGTDLGASSVVGGPEGMANTGIYATPSGGDVGQGAQNLSGSPQTEQWVTPPYSPNSRYLTGVGPGAVRPPVVPGQAPPGQVAVPGSPGQFINPNNPNQRDQPVSIPKNPDINAQEQRWLSEFKKGASDSLQGFDNYLKTFRSALDSAFGATQKANDPTGTINTLNQNQRTYNAGLAGAATDYAALNKNTAAAEQGIVQQATDLLPSYNAAADAAANIAMQQVAQQVNRYKAGSGAPTGLSSAELAQIQAGDAAILVPLEQAKIQQAYSVLQNYALPTTIDIANRETNRIASFTPEILAQQFQTGQATAQTIQALLQQTSQMSMQDAQQYMTAIGVPAQVMQQILSGQITQLGALNTLESQSNYQGLRDVLGTPVDQATGPSLRTGAYPNQNRYQPTGGTPGAPGGAPAVAPGALPGFGTPAAGGAPAGAQGDWVYNSNNGYWQNWKTGDVTRTDPTQGGAGGAQSPSSFYPPLPPQDSSEPSYYADVGTG